MIQGYRRGLEDPLEKGMVSHSSMLAWRVHGQRSPVGYSPWGHKELDMPEHSCMHGRQAKFPDSINIPLCVHEAVD